jgi:hypothetical protein
MDGLIRGSRRKALKLLARRATERGNEKEKVSEEGRR